MSDPANLPRDRPSVADLKALWVVDKTGGRPVDIIKRGRVWLHLHPKYSYDKPRVSIELLERRGCAPVEEWRNETAWLSAEQWVERTEAASIWGTIQGAIRYRPAPTDIPVEDMRHAAELLRVMEKP